MLFNLCSIGKYFNSTEKLEMPIGISTKEPKAETETHLVIAEAKLRNIECDLKLCNSFVFLTHKIILVYFFNEITSFSFYIFQSNSWLMFSAAVVSFKIMIHKTLSCYELY